eukprot:TRINITY_DN32565_c0_g1_i1.p2 TRINITY_DN32565_c0_g1~~TRINITY_DN32565_c0_g1_i1.p2  ORF type:complete len:146 (-),score=23.14 TRINITY_DN32565_c0_g1_i1:166-603(-)
MSFIAVPQPGQYNYGAYAQQYAPQPHLAAMQPQHHVYQAQPMPTQMHHVGAPAGPAPLVPASSMLHYPSYPASSAMNGPFKFSADPVPGAAPPGAPVAAVGQERVGAPLQVPGAPAMLAPPAKPLSTATANKRKKAKKKKSSGCC